MAYKDPEKQREYDRKRYKADPEKRRAAARNTMTKRRANPAINELLKRTMRYHMRSYRKWWTDTREALGFGQCYACGSEKNIHIHHVGKKAFTPSCIYSSCPSSERLLLYINELKKCIPLCRKCHEKIHSKKKGEVHAAITQNLISDIAGRLVSIPGN